METEIIIALISLISVIIGSLVTHFLTVKKYSAEVDKTKAETEKLRAETERMRSESQTNKVLHENAGILTTEQMDEVAKRIAEKVRLIKTEVQNTLPDVLYTPAKLPDRIIYLYTVRGDIERKIQNLVLSYGGPWAGCSMADIENYLDKARSFLTDDLNMELSDFYSYTQIMLNTSNNISDLDFLKIQYLAANINSQLETAYQRLLETNQLPLDSKTQ